MGFMVFGGAACLSVLAIPTGTVKAFKSSMDPIEQGIYFRYVLNCFLNPNFDIYNNDLYSS